MEKKNEEKVVIVRFPKGRADAEIFSGNDKLDIPKNLIFNELESYSRNDELGYLVSIGDTSENNIGFIMNSNKKTLSTIYVSFEDKFDPYCEKFKNVHTENRVKRLNKSIKNFETYNKCWEMAKIGAGIVLGVGTIVGISAMLAKGWQQEGKMAAEAMEEYFRNNSLASDIVNGIHR